MRVPPGTSVPPPIATPPSTPPPFATPAVTAVAVVLAGVLTALSGRYGFHRDELYFLQAGERLAWGYVDQPPLTPFLARVSVELFGQTPGGLRVVATLACVASVVVVALIARELNGGRRAQVLAAIATAISGYVLAVGHMVSTSTFDVLVWLVLSWLALRLLRTSDGRWWLPIGVVAGIGLLNKYLVALLLAALLAGLVAVGPRRVLRSWWLVGAVAVALVIVAPNLWWQATNGWPQLTVAGGISAESGTEDRVMFPVEQVLLLSPVLVPVWGAGLWRLWREAGIRWARSVVVAYLVLCVLVVALGGKGYYAIPLLLVPLAAGCQPVVAWLGRGRARARHGVFGAALATGAVMSALISLPVLPPSALTTVNTINREQGEQVGWPALVSTVAEVWSTIPPEDRDSAVVFTANYGQAGAIAHYRARYDLPEPYSGHMSHADWGPPPDTADGPVVLLHPDDASANERFFTGCREAARVDNGEGVDNEEQGTVVTLCEGTTRPWSILWPELRHYY